MRLLVLGASGRIGRLIVGEAVRRGHRVTGQSRSAARVPLPALPAVGHPADPAFLKAIVPDHDAVICALGGDPDPAAKPFSDATRALLPAMRATGTSRLVAITGAGRTQTRPPGHWLFARLLAPIRRREPHPDKAAQEDLIAASDLEWTIIRPGPIADGPLPGGLHAWWPVPPDVQVTAITRAEVAQIVLDAVEQQRWRRARPLVGHLA